MVLYTGKLKNISKIRQISFSAITSHNRFDTAGRAATSVHLGRQHIACGFHERNRCGAKHKQTIEKQSVENSVFLSKN